MSLWLYLGEGRGVHWAFIEWEEYGDDGQRTAFLLARPFFSRQVTESTRRELVRPWIELLECSARVGLCLCNSRGFNWRRR